MKKLFLLFMLVFASTALIACGEREFPFDGEFLAYEVSVHRGQAPQVVFVTVTIENDKVTGYSIDTRQGARVATTTGEGEEAVTTYSYRWNEETKYELGDRYGMKNVSEIDKEWFEQADALIAFWLENGLDAVTTNDDGYVDNVTGVSMRDPYTPLAKQALENAKEGRFIGLYQPQTGSPDLYIAEMVLTGKGDIESLVIDVLQARGNAETGVFVWRDQTKQELGYAYRMHRQNNLSEADYIQYLRDNDLLEWFEQVELITDDIIENGWRTNAISDLPAGVSITADGYYTVLANLFAFAGNAVK